MRVTLALHVQVSSELWSLVDVVLLSCMNLVTKYVIKIWNFVCRDNR